MILITKLKSFLSSIPNYELPLFIQQKKLDTKIFYAKTRPQKIKYFLLFQITKLPLLKLIIIPIQQRKPRET